MWSKLPQISWNLGWRFSMGCYDGPRKPQPRFKADLSLLPLLPFLLLSSISLSNSLFGPVHSCFTPCKGKPCVSVEQGLGWHCPTASPNACWPSQGWPPDPHWFLAPKMSAQPFFFEQLGDAHECFIAPWSSLGPQATCFSTPGTSSSTWPSPSQGIRTQSPTATPGWSL